MTNRRQLNKGQVTVLKALYKFRFGTRDLIAASLNTQNGNPMYSRLSILEEQGLVAKRYAPSYKLAGRAAEYYLTPHGMRALLGHVELDGLDDAAVKASYKDKTASEQFLRRNLMIYALHNRLTAIYAPLKVFTKRELAAFEYFPAQLPDAYLAYTTDGNTKSYFLELFTSDTPSFAIDRRFRQLIAYYEDGDWSVTGMAFPAILCIAETGNIERLVRKQIARALNRSSADMQFYTSTVPAVCHASKDVDAIWTGIDEPDALLSLSDLA